MCLDWEMKCGGGHLISSGNRGSMYIGDCDGHATPDKSCQVNVQGHLLFRLTLTYHAAAAVILTGPYSLLLLLSHLIVATLHHVVSPFLTWLPRHVFLAS